MMFWIFLGLMVIYVSKNDADSQCKPWSLDSLCRNTSDNNCKELKEMIHGGIHNNSPKAIGQKCKDEKGDGKFQSLCAMESFINTCEHGMHQNFLRDIDELEDVLEETNVSESTLFCGDSYSALLYQPDDPFNGAEFHSDNNMSVTYHHNANATVSVYLPASLDIGEEHKIIFCILQFPNGTIQNSTLKLYGQRLVGLSVANKTISGLSERVNLTMSFSLGQNQSSEEPLCVFLNNSAGNWSSNGCQTLWDKNQSQVTCSCNHLTYFGVLLVPINLSSEDLQRLSYITLIGSGISLTALVFTVVLFFTHKKIRVDDSRKIHINLVFALIFLNLHFLPNEMVATSSSSGLCLYMALALHYFLLATLCWMALEGFHLYLLIVKVFNIYISRYLLKVSVIGWGVPAVILSIVVSINKKYYGLAKFSDSTQLCFITDSKVRLVTTLGPFALLFISNTVMFSMTVRYLITNQHHKENRMQDMAMLLALITLLGLGWGCFFFTFWRQATPLLYIFSTVNSLQGFFIFLYFVLTLRKIKDPETTTGNTTNS
ncbi:adhesion G-protein coupled receptor G2-like [Oryzias latipes]|uniref:adhesion G-protein coupled receptor G2-like n=1 Tax=Oryzias latipes TaxID=8090 RepID=UPI000CE21D88|nr:adhesion G-protein coupled receptor G2-like [Oryzias latipes]